MSCYNETCWLAPVLDIRENKIITDSLTVTGAVDLPLTNAASAAAAGSNEREYARR